MPVARESARAMRDVLRASFEDAAEGIFVASVEGRILAANREAARLLGYATADELMAGVPDARAVHADPQRHDDLLDALAAEGAVRDFHVEAKRRDGSTARLALHARALRDGTGRFWAFEGFVQDVTERRRVERERDGLVDELRERVKELTALHALARDLQEPGARTTQELLAAVADILPPAYRYPDVTAARVQVGDVAAETPGFRRGHWLQSASFTLADGRKGSLAVAYLGLYLPGTGDPFSLEEHAVLDSAAELLKGHLDHAAALAEARKAEERQAEILRLQDQARFRLQFFNAVAHEVNNPLTPMKIQLYLLKQRPSQDDVQRRAVAVLERSVDQVTALARDFLDVARIERGSLRLSLGDVDVAEVARQTAETYLPLAAEAGVDLVVEAAEPATVRADRQRIVQVLTNLLSNALKATPEGGRVAVRAERTPDGARVAVADTGVGLTPEQAGRLFEPFSQVHDATAKKGTGLGLYVSKGLVTSHGGTIAVASDGPGRGATFAFALPRRGPPAT